MDPPTSNPASARTKPRMRDTAFREVTARANVVSRSEQDFLSVMTKDEVLTGKPSKTGLASRRYSIASKFEDPKAVSSSTAAADAKPKINKRASFLGVPNVPQLNGRSTQASSASGKSTAAPSSNATGNKPAAPLFQETKSGFLPKRPSIAPQQVNKLQKPALDVRKRIVSGREKAESLQINHTSKTSRMVLKSAHYWLEQVNLAEVMQKHGVSAGFFRLAVECEAEPRQLLRDELIAYIKRHSLWSSSIQQVLLCYNVDADTQSTLFSELSANVASDSSSPCTPAKTLEGVLSNERELAHRERDYVSIGDTMPKDRLEESSIKETTLSLQNLPLHCASGHIKSMDADTIARTLVSIIMSSMNCPDSCSNFENDVLAEPVDKRSYGQNNLGSSRTSEVEASMLCVQESISTHTAADLDESTSIGSLPSLNVWTTTEDSAITSDVQHKDTLGNDMRGAVSTLSGKLAGDEMCVSMELDVDDSTCDNQSDLQSKSPNFQGASSEESPLHASQTANDVHDDVVKCPDVNGYSDLAISAAGGNSHDTVSKDLIYEENPDRQSGKWQIGLHKGGKKEITMPKAEIEKCTAIETLSLPELQGNQRSSSSPAGKPRNGNEKPVAPSDYRKTEVPALNTDSAASITLINSRRLSTSTPKSSTLANVSNSEIGSRTRRKPRVSQYIKPGNESDCIELKCPIVASEGALTSPRQESRVLSVDEAKQVSSKVMDIRPTDISGSMATPGSAAVRRSARLMRPSGGGTTVSTPGSVSTRVQRRLRTPSPADKELTT